MFVSTLRLPVRCAVLLSVAVLAACASTPQQTAASAAKDEVVTVRPGPHGHRFDMQQNGRSMTAEEFDAWMKARGIRVAKGAPARPKATATTTAKAAAPAKRAR